MDITALEKQLTALQDIEAIKQLKAEYCDICDDAHNPDRIVTIFADDGIWEAEGVGYAQGPAELRTSNSRSGGRRLWGERRRTSNRHAE